MTKRETLLMYYFCQQFEFSCKESNNTLSKDWTEYYRNKEAQFKELFNDSEIEMLEDTRRRMWDFNRQMVLLTESDEFKEAVNKYKNN